MVWREIEIVLREIRSLVSEELRIEREIVLMHGEVIPGKREIEIILREIKLISV
ncbi:hypothetical protein [Carboxylicivirga marina]|uniref:Uncharacterized protein n=1 Tax=Carboxylicivirga marina TaxID=2800988 RepID=A0ABS1HQX3_9BACT|nr:hypothetical protein [Carboxylicivirga marina]MBK3519952.1 hypothetical protein [Carboxylicivirga marina]